MAADAEPGVVQPVPAADSSRRVDIRSAPWSPGVVAGASTALVLTVALQNAIPPFAIDMYTPAFPEVTTSLETQASLVGLTLTTFFLGMGLGQLIGGPVSDQRGRRLPLVAGALICTVGAVGCALAPSIGVLILCRTVQGLGGGVASVVARAVLIDVARGDQLARLMSVMMALVGIAPMIAPVIGGTILAVGGDWRLIFWCLVGLGLLMTTTAAIVVPETLSSAGRHTGGLRGFPATAITLVKDRQFLGFMMTSAFSSFATMAYITTSSYVLQGMKGLQPFAFAVTFAAIALFRTVVSLMAARLVGRFSPHTLVRFGLLGSLAAVVVLAVGVFGWGTPLGMTIAGFLLLMGAQAFVFGNVNALASSRGTHVAGSASAMLGVAQALAGSASAPLSSAGGGTTAVPMVLVMAAGMLAATVAFFAVAHPRTGRRTSAD